MKKRWSAFLAVMLLLLALVNGCSEAPEEQEHEKNADQEVALTVMTQNLRIGSDDGEENDVLQRSDRFIALLDQYQPDLIGLQEYSDEWDFMLTEYIDQSVYEIVFKYRSSVDPEATPIMYNAEKLELLSHKFWWLSETPEVESTSWDEEFERCRIVTECVFKEKASGIEFVHINTHFGSTDISQPESGALVSRRIKENHAGRPLFLTGDFNMSESSLAYRYLTEDGSLFDSFYLANEFGETCGTYNGYEDGDHIGTLDYIFVSPQVDVSYYGVLTDKPNGLFVSDHYGVLTKNIIHG